jgi:O-succinylbenzoic acid--CoA ligase
MITCPLQQATEMMPEATALVHGEGRLSFRELDALVSGTAGALAEQDVTVGARVPFMAPNTWESVVMLLAIIRAGAVACPISVRHPASLVGMQTACLGSRPILTEESVAQTVTGASGQSCPGVPCEDDRPATALFTSGTTGVPKIAMLSLKNHLASAEASNHHNGLAAGDRWLLSIPLYHVGGLAIIYRCFRASAALVLARGDLPVVIETCGVTHLSLVPTQLKRLLATLPIPSNLQGLRSILLGGAPIPAALMADAKARGLPVFPTYGMTETSSQVATVLPGGCWPESGASILPCNEVQVGPDGEIRVRGDNVFLGYLEDGNLRKITDACGWFSTGDLGEIDDRGFLRVHGRRDKLIISGGENIYPEEIEAALMGMDDVEQARVLAIEDDEFGQRPVAYVRTQSGELKPDVLVAALEQILPRFKIPVAFRDWEMQTETRIA